MTTRFQEENAEPGRRQEESSHAPAGPGTDDDDVVAFLSATHNRPRTPVPVVWVTDCPDKTIIPRRFLERCGPP